MIAVLQRVSEASVRVEGAVIGQIGAGLLVLLCAEKGDTEAVADRMLAKMLKLRIFSDAGKMNLSVQDVGGGLLIVSQFTLAADVAGGNRPSFTQAAPPEDGRHLYDYFVAQAQRGAPRGANRPLCRGHEGALGQRRADHDPNENERLKPSPPPIIGA